MAQVAAYYVRHAMVHLSGWYDAYSRTATGNYIGFSKRNRGPARLIMGPWTHGARQSRRHRLCLIHFAAKLSRLASRS